MYLRLKNRMERIKKELEKGVPKQDIPMSGTLMVIDGALDFTKTDGFIQFLKVTLDHAPKAYGGPDQKWRAELDGIYKEALKLQDARTRFMGSTRMDFSRYCAHLSHVMDVGKNPIPSLDVLQLDSCTEGNLVPFMEKHLERKNYGAFYYEPEENVAKKLTMDLVGQLSNIKMEKEGPKDYEISCYLTRAGYHEHVHDALNVLLQAAVYAINCRSTRERACHGFDVQKLSNDLAYAKAIMERTADVI